MKRDYFFYAVQTEVRFTEPEVDAMIACSERHYDAKCRSLSKVGGFLYGMKNQVRKDIGDPVEDAARNFSTHDLDILQKVLEGANTPLEHSLYQQVRSLHLEALAESEKVNAHCR